MSNLVKYKNSIWVKIKRNLSNFFKIFAHNKKETIEDNFIQQTDNQGKNNKANVQSAQSFRDMLQKDIKNEKIKNDILNIIDNNFEVLYSIPKERLKQISELYDEENEKMKLKILGK